MTKPGEKTKKKKFRRIPGEKSRVYYVREKTSKHHCAICRGILHGTPHGRTKAGVKKLSKTQRRPSVPFGGVLCSTCRKNVFEDAAKVKSGGKNFDEVDFTRRKYVEIALKKL